MQWGLRCLAALSVVVALGGCWGSGSDAEPTREAARVDEARQVIAERYEALTEVLRSTPRDGASGRARRERARSILESPLLDHPKWLERSLGNPRPMPDRCWEGVSPEQLEAYTEIVHRAAVVAFVSDVEELAGAPVDHASTVYDDGTLAITTTRRGPGSVSTLDFIHWRVHLVDGQWRVFGLRREATGDPEGLMTCLRVRQSGWDEALQMLDGLVAEDEQRAFGDLGSP